MTHRPPLGQQKTTESRPHRILPVAGIVAVVVALLAHLGGGAALMHAGLSADGAVQGGRTLLIGLAGIVVLKLVVAVGARRWWRSR